MLPLMQPVPIAEVPKGILLRIVGAAGAGFPSPAQDWQDDAISLIELLRLDRAASFVFRISGSSMIEAGIYDNDVVVVDRDTRPAEGHIVVAAYNDVRPDAQYTAGLDARSLRRPSLWDARSLIPRACLVRPTRDTHRRTHAMRDAAQSGSPAARISSVSSRARAGSSAPRSSLRISSGLASNWSARLFTS